MTKCKMVLTVCALAIDAFCQSLSSRQVHPTWLTQQLHHKLDRLRRPAFRTLCRGIFKSSTRTRLACALHEGVRHVTNGLSSGKHSFSLSCCRMYWDVLLKCVFANLGNTSRLFAACKLFSLCRTVTLLHSVSRLLKLWFWRFSQLFYWQA